LDAKSGQKNSILADNIKKDSLYITTSGDTINARKTRTVNPIAAVLSLFLK